MPLISVVIPVYNGEKTIRETIESVLNQTLKDLEILVINDGSLDDTLQVLESILDARLQIFSYTNAGLAKSRNRGIELSIGEYISFIDADDLWTPDKLEAQLKMLQSNKNAALAYSWTNYIDANGNFVKAGRRTTATGNVYSKLLVWNFLENGSNPLIKKEALQVVGNFDESLTAAEDWDMWLRLAASYEFVCVQKPQILYRVIPNSMSANLKRQEAESLKVIQSAFSHPKAESLQHLKKYTLAHLYKYLAFKGLDATKDLQNRFISAQFLWNCVKYDPSVLQQRRVMAIAILKIAFPGFYERLKQFSKQVSKT